MNILHEQLQELIDTGQDPADWEALYERAVEWEYVELALHIARYREDYRQHMPQC